MQRDNNESDVICFPGVCSLTARGESSAYLLGQSQEKSKKLKAWTSQDLKLKKKLLSLVEGNMIALPWILGCQTISQSQIVSRTFLYWDLERI